jgi:glycosyltransferase involved in cell wall biosynthesis
MRVGIDIGKLAGPRDGVGNYVYQLVRALMRVDRENRYLLFGHSAEMAVDRFAQLFGSPPANFTLESGSAVPESEIDLFHGPAYKVPQGLRGRTVFTIHDLTFLTHPEFHTIANRLHCFKGTLNAVMAESRYIAVSAFARQSACDVLGLDEERITVIHHGIDPFFSPGESEQEWETLRRRHSLRPDYLLFVGTVEPRKNVMRLIRAYEALSEELRRRHMLVIAGGKGWLNSDIYDYAEARLGEDSVRFLGYVGDEDLRALYRFTTAFVYPSVAEGFGLPVLEAMACGAPVVTSDATSLPEVAGDAALLVSPTDVGAIREALERVLGDDSLRLGLKRKGLERSAGFSWERAAEQTIAVYSSCL